MSDISLYPQGIDIFTTKVDEIGDGNGDYIMAEHMNRVQNAITAVELALGENPQGGESSVAQRLYSLSKSKTLSPPRIAIHNGDPSKVNGATNAAEAAKHFSYLSIAMLDNITLSEGNISVISDVIEETNKLGSTVFYGTVDAGVSTSNLTIDNISGLVEKWKAAGVRGIYYKNFGYDALVNRQRQNALIDVARSNDLLVIVSATNIDHVFSLDNTNGNNPSGDAISLGPNDGYLALGFATQGLYYQNSAELLSTAQKMLAYRSAYGVSIYGIGYIDGADQVEVNKKYYYGSAAAMTYSLDGFHSCPAVVPDNRIYYYKTFPMVGDYYDKAPKISIDGNVVTRESGLGSIVLDTYSHSYDFSNLRIPLKFIDFSSDDSTIDAARLSGTMPSSVSIDIIGRINSDESIKTIKASKVDVDGTKVINAINLISSGPVKISAEAISSLSSANIEDIVIESLGKALDTELSSGELDVNVRRLMAKYLSAQNAYFDSMIAETGSFDGLNAGILTAGYLNAGLISAESITSDKLSIYANSGVNKWSGVVVGKANADAIPAPGPVNVNGKDVQKKIETKDIMPIITSDIIGSSATNYVVLWETNVYCTENFDWTESFTANSNATLYINGTLVKTVAAGATEVYTGHLLAGWNTIQVYQDHSSQTSCSFNIGIKFSQYANQTENGTNTKVARMDAYSSRATVITGDTIKTSSITVDKLDANVLSASNIRSGALAVDTTINVGSGISIKGTGEIRAQKSPTEYILIDANSGLFVEGGLLNVKIKNGDLDSVVINNNGIWAGNATNYTTLNGNGINIVTAVSGANKLELNSSGITATHSDGNRVEFDGQGIRCISGGELLGSAITHQGIYGQLLTDQSVPGSKFDKTPPAVPSNVNATQQIEQTATSEFININVTWSAVGDADLEGYKVYLKEGAGLYMPMAIVQKDQTSYKIRNVKGSTQYYVAVSSYDVTGNESAKSPDKAILTTKDTIAPKTIDASGFVIVDGIKMFYIRWNPVLLNSDDTECVDMDYYEVERHDGSTWTPVNKTYSTSIVDKDIAYDTYYKYRIRAVDLSGNASAWIEKDAGEASRVGAADIVAGSITAEVLNVGSMVKNINPNRTILFHYDGVLTSTQDMRPVSTSGGAWVSGKFGNAIALEEATVNLISNATSGNSGFSNGTTGWTAGGAEYKTTGGTGGADDGYVEVNSANKISITVTGLTANKAYTLSLYAKNALFNEPTDLVVKKDGAEIIRSGQRSEWNRVKYTFTTGAAQTSVAFEFSSIDARKIGIDNIQLEQRDFMTAYTESFLLDDSVRPHGWVMYSSERLNPKQGIISFWYKPNRNGKSPSQNSRILFYWGNSSSDRITLFLDDANKPKLKIVSSGTTKEITHINAIDSNDWNLVTARWNCDPTTDDAEKYMDITLNGEPTIEDNRVDLVGFVAPSISESYFTIGNYNEDTTSSANGYFDEFRIDTAINMDIQEREEIISWYKQGSTFYDASSQIDADSQGISAANAKVRINSEGITVQDGLIKVVSDDGMTLIGGGRININGMNVGVAQSDNEVYNGNFSVPDTLYGIGDMYLTAAGLYNFGAKYWRSRRSSGPRYANVLQQAAWNRFLVDAVINWNEIYDQLYATYNTSIRADEAATHSIETIVRATPPISLMPAGAEKEALVADTLEDELKYQISKATDTKYQEWKNLGMSAVRYNNERGNLVANIVRYDQDANKLYYVKYKVDPWTGAYSIDPNEIDPTTLLPKMYEATKENGNYGHVVFDVWPDETLLGKSSYARLGVDTVDGKPTAGVIGVGDGATSVFSIPNPPIAAVLQVTVDGAMKYPSLHYNVNIMTGTITFLPGSIPGFGAIVAAAWNTIDVSAQATSLEQNLLNLVTYTDGLEPEGTYWNQQVFTFYAKWENKPVGSQSKLFFDVEELVPNYSVDENNMAHVLPSFKIEVPDSATNLQDFLVANTDFVGQKYRTALGHVSYLDSDIERKSPIINSVRYATILPTLKVRYIRDWANGSTDSTNSHWSEVMAIDALGNVVSAGCTVTGSHTITNPTRITDGSFSNYATITTQSSPVWVQVDLGQVRSLGAITVWHYFADGRTYHGTRTQVSEDGVKWYDVFNSAYQGEYTETVEGHTIGGATGMTPNPIIVEEILTPIGETVKTGWRIKTDGLSILGMTKPKYFASSQTGDMLMIDWTSESTIDFAVHSIQDPKSGYCAVYTDGKFYGQVDTSFPVPSVSGLKDNGFPAGSHRFMVVATGQTGFNTVLPESETPYFAGYMLEFFDWTSHVYTTSVEYIEEDPTNWNKVVIRPNKTNNKDSGTPAITTSNVPIKYRVKARFEKPLGDPFGATVFITGVQGETGYNESFSRVTYGKGSIPGLMIQWYNPEIFNTGITAQHLQDYTPGSPIESGVQERHIADYQVTTRKLARGSVTMNVLADGNVTRNKLAFVSKYRPAMNLTPPDFPYPVELPVNVDPKVRYIPDKIDEGFENIYLDGQLLCPSSPEYPDEDYSIEIVPGAKHSILVGATPETMETHAGPGNVIRLDHGKLSHFYNGSLEVPKITVYKNGQPTPLTMGVDYIVSETTSVVDGETLYYADVVLTAPLSAIEFISAQYYYVDEEVLVTKIVFNRTILPDNKVWVDYWISVE